MATSESTAIEIILRHSKLISEAIQQRAELEGLAPGEAGLAAAVQEVRGDALGARMAHRVDRAERALKLRDIA